MGQEALDRRVSIKESALDYFQQVLRDYWYASEQQGLDSSDQDSLEREIEFSRTILRSQDLQPYDLLSAVTSALSPQDRVEILLPIMVAKLNLSKNEEERFRTAFVSLP